MQNIQHSSTENQSIVLPKNSLEQLHLAVRKYSGHTCVDLRIHFKDGNAEWKPDGGQV